MEAVDFPPVLMFAAPLFALAVAVEWWAVRRGHWGGRYAWRDGWASMAMGTGSLVSDLLMGALSVGLLMWVWQFRVLDWGVGVGAFLAALVLGDLVYYWKHRLAHRVRLWWTAHVVHHSSEHYNLTTALRQPWTNHVMGHILLSSPLVLLGFHPGLVAFAASLNLLYQFWIHTEAIDRMPGGASGWFERVFNTPSHHRVHHATHPLALDRNYAGILIVWDKLFGTFQDESDMPGGKDAHRYGTVAPVSTHNPVRIAFEESVGALRDVARPGLSLKSRLLHLVAPPGWSADGSRQTSDQMRADYLARTSARAKTLASAQTGASSAAASTPSTNAASATT